MASVFEKRSQDLGMHDPAKQGTGSVFERRANATGQGEGTLKSLARTGAQIPLGAAEATPYGILTGLWQMIGTGESLDPEEIDQLKKISDRVGVEFDEDKYRQAAQQAAGTIPTISNLAELAEEKTGLPLTPRTKTQKLLRLASTAGKFQQGGVVQKGVAGAATAGTAAGLEHLGVPENIAELAGLAAGGGAGALAEKLPSPSIGAKTKPSGLPERGFETLKSPREVSEGKMAKINEKLESDFKTRAYEIITESPVGETFENLKNDPAYKQQSRELLDEAQVIADKTPGKFNTDSLKKKIVEKAQRAIKGLAASEYDKSFAKFVMEGVKDFFGKEGTFGQLVEQYRKNNQQLSEYFEPGSSKAYNRAKRDALLEQNRAIAEFMEESLPESELVPVFKEGNQRWSRIMDAEAIDGFVSDFTEGKINFKKGDMFFDDANTGRIFKKALGDKYPLFEQLMKDMMQSEAPYKMLKVAKDKGFSDLWNSAKYYVLHPKAGALHSGAKLLKGSLKFAMNIMLDKPKIAVTWKRAVDSLKKGDFKAAEREFKTLQGEIEEPAKVTPPFKAGETVEVKGERIRPEAEAKGIEHKPGEPVKEAKPEAPKPAPAKPKSDSDIRESVEGIIADSEMSRVTKEKKLRELDIDPDQVLGVKPKAAAPKAEESTNKYSPEEIVEMDYEYNPNLGRKELKPKEASKIEKPKSSKKLTKAEEEHILPPKKAKPSKAPKKTKLEALEEGLTEAKKKVEHRKTRLSIEEPSAITRRVKKQQLEAAEKRVKDLEEAIDELPKPKKESKTPPAQEAKIENMERQDISKKGLKEQKQWLINELEEAIAKAPKEFKVDKVDPAIEKIKQEIKKLEYQLNEAPWNKQKSIKDSLADKRSILHMKKQAAMDASPDYLSFKVPGDGTFKIRNHRGALEAFRDSVEKRWPDKPLKISDKQLQIRRKAKEETPTQRQFDEYIKQHGTAR